MSIAKAVLPGAMRLTGRGRAWRSREGVLHAVDHRDPWPAAVPPQPGIALEVRREQGWPVARLVPPNPRGTYVHLHGGAYLFGPVPQHWSLLRALALASGRTVVAPLYPLAPAGTAAEVVPAATTIVAAEDPTDLVLGGDSAGGGIALAVAQRLASQGARPRLAFIAPWIDARLDDPATAEADRRDPWLSALGLRVAAELYAGGLPLDDPLVSPLLGPLADLGATTIITGTRDVLHPQALALAESLTAAGVPVDLHVAAGMLHVPPLLPVPEARPYRRLLADLLRAR